MVLDDWSTRGICARPKRKRARRRPVVASDLPMMMISPSRVVARVGVVSFLSFEEEEEEEEDNASTLNETSMNTKIQFRKQRHKETTTANDFRRGKDEQNAPKRPGKEKKDDA